MGHTPSGTGRLRVLDGRLDLEVLDDEGRHLATSLPLDRSQRHAVQHLHAVHASRPCLTEGHRPVVDALFAALDALGARATALVVDDGPPASFELAIRDRTGERQVPLDVVDAAALIFARGVPLRVLAPPLDWDATVAELLAT